MSGEAKASAKTLSIENITVDTGIDNILERLDKSYLVDTADQLDLDLSAFLDFTWKSTMTVEEYVAGFHVRVDKIASHNLDEKIKGHLMLHQAGLDDQTRNMIVGAASGNYNVSSILAALRQAFRSAS